MKPDAPSENFEWHGSNVETDREIVTDPGSGKPVILRQFEFKYPPGHVGQPHPEEILTPDYRTYLNNMLWLDDLELIQDLKVVFNKKGFSVFATCQARKGRIIPSEHLNAMRPLQDRLNERTRNSV